MAFSKNDSRSDLPGLGWALGIGALLGAAVGWVATDMNKPNSTVRRWIEIGKRKHERKVLEEEVEGTPEQTAVEESVLEAIENPPEELLPGERPPEERPPEQPM